MYDCSSLESGNKERKKERKEGRKRGTKRERKSLAKNEVILTIAYNVETACSLNMPGYLLQ
jgi:hypothetical protein